MTVTRPGPAMRRLDVQSFLRSAGKSTEIEGTTTILLRFNGSAVTGSISATGGWHGAGLTGTVGNGMCRLAAEDGSLSIEGSCGRTGFKGRISGRGAGTTLSGRFETSAKTVIDVAEREQQREDAAAAAREEARRKAEAQRQAMAQLEARAAAGNVEAMWVAGMTYESGEKIGQDYAKAAAWYQRAAAKGFGPAYRGLARLYYEGNGVPQSKARAFDNFLACANAAELKDFYESKTGCMYLAAQSLYLGIGVVRNEAAAARWFRACAARKNDDCIEWINEHGVR
ncbi:tetratricopeptide repeat protein [Sphingomonas montanisoli]|nr:hypothetical protein [Sphingomonas montanisoli]